jgi:outer membrane receptor protein involved in Fe transport
MKRLFCFFLLASQIGLAGTTGKIAGRAFDASTKQPLPMVNIQIVGTTYGAATDVDGNYFIINVPIGTYSLHASIIGYATKTVSNVKVMLDMTTTIDFPLDATDVQMNEVVVVASRPPIQPDLTSTKHIVDADAINTLPVDDFREIVQLQAGVSGSHFRGGRFNEALFLVDGMAIKNAINSYSGTTTAGFATNLPELGISEIQVTTGGFEAEYGNAQSGIVNALTRDQNRLSAKLRIRTSDFPWSNMQWSPNAYGQGQPDWKNYEAYVSAPSVAMGDVNFFLNGSANIALQSRDFLPHENFYRESYQAKLRAVTPNTRLTISGLWSWDQTNDYYHSSSKYGPLSQGYQTNLFQQIITVGGVKTLQQYVFVTDPQNYHNAPTPDSAYYNGGAGNAANGWYKNVMNIYQAGMQENISVPITKSYNIGISLNQTLNNHSFIDVKLSQFWSNFREIVHDVNDRNGNGSTTDELHWQLNGGIGGYYSHLSTDGYWYYTGDEGWYLNQVSRSTNLRVDYSNQLNSSNLLKTGIETAYIKGGVEKVTFESVSNPRFDLWDQDLVDFAAYAQDKIEVRDGFIVNAGVRFDYYNPNGLTNSVLYPSDPTTLPSHKDGQGLTSGDKIPARWQISPRIGISHPITERDKIHFYYGHFFQRPDLRFLYENIALNFRYTTNVDLGNPRLQPEKTVSYELGWDHIFSDLLRMNTTLYFKDITNLIGATDYVISGSPDSYQAYTNMDYANVRGLEVTLETMGNRGIGGMVNVSYAFANGRSSSVFRSNGEIVPRRLDPLDWDVRWRINANLLLTSTGAVRDLIGDAEVDFVVVAHSGYPYSTNTRDAFPLFVLRNDGRLPWASNVDMRARKSFALGDIMFSALAEVKNLFDTRNVSYISGGRDGLVEYEATGNPTGPYNDPQAYTPPRTYRLGFEMQF